MLDFTTSEGSLTTNWGYLFHTCTAIATKLGNPVGDSGFVYNDDIVQIVVSQEPASNDIEKQGQGLVVYLRRPEELVVFASKTTGEIVVADIRHVYLYGYLEYLLIKGVL